MSVRIVFRPKRLRRSVAAGSIVTLLSTFLFPVIGVAATIRIYEDRFVNESFSGSDGTASWAGPWIENGENDGPASGAIEVPSDGVGHCHTSGCLRIGRNGSDAASVRRTFDSSGASSVTLTFDYKRHLHSGGTGSIVLAASPDGTAWTVVDTFDLTVDDGSQQAASYDLTPYGGSTAAIRFGLLGGWDDSHMNIDNLSIVTTTVGAPVFDQDLGDRTDPEQAQLSIDAGATDPDGDQLTYSATGLPPGAGIDALTGAITGVLTALASAASPYAVTVTVTDGTETDQDNFIWTVDEVNQNPIAQDRAVSVAEDDGSGVTVDLVDAAFANDPDGDSLSLTGLDLSSLTGGGVTDHGDGTVTYVPDSDFDQIDTFAFTVSDGRGGSATGQVVITVQPAADSPVLGPVPSLAVAEETIASMTAAATDPDSGDGLTFSLEPGPDPVPAGAVIDPVTGDFTWTPGEDDGPGIFQFTVRVTDATGLFDEAALLVDISEANRSPMLGAMADRSDPEGAVVSLSVPFTDPDTPADTVVFTAGDLPPGLSIDEDTGAITGTISYDGAAGSPHTVVVTVSDDGAPALTDSKTFVWAISEVNREPDAGAPLPDVTVNEGGQVSIDPYAIDPDGDPLNWSANGLPAGIGIDGSTGALTGTVAAGSTQGSPYQVVVTADDSNGGSVAFTFTITVVLPPPPPPPSTTTTTTADAVTTTTLPAATTTSSPTDPVATTTAPVASPGLTDPTSPPTTEPPTATTTAVELGPPIPPSPTDPPATLTVTQAREAKENLVISSPSIDSNGLDESGDSQLTNQLDPREGMAVSFASAVETLKDNLVNSVLLGIAFAVLLLLGIDKSEERKRPLATV